MYDVLIVGGGLAGCSAAIHLARAGVSVLLLERGTYPAHKLCGEFLSVETTGAFERLGVLPAIQAAGAQPISRILMTTPSGASLRQDLPGTALGFSRYRLDEILFHQARSVGADAREGVSVLNVTGDLGQGFRVETTAGQFAARVVLGAYGKKAPLDAKLGREPDAWNAPFVGYKEHCMGFDLPGVVEVHLFPGGYCGLAQVEDGSINVCWIARRQVVTAAGGNRERATHETLSQNPALAARLAALTPVPGTLRAIGGVTLARKGVFQGGVAMIGDTAQMIAPFCGDGMGMALRTGEIIAPLASQFLSGNLTQEQFQNAYARQWREEFSLRLMLGKWLQSGALTPGVSETAMRAAAAFTPLTRWVIAQTRGAADQAVSNTAPSMVRPGPKASATPGP